MDLRRLTVIVPTYNRRDSLRRCVEGILACDPGARDITVRIADDGSEDGTGEVVEELRRRSPPPFRIEHHYHQNQGQSAARNTAIAAADTDLILFTDDDCVPEPGWIRAMVETPWEPDVAGAGGRLAAGEPRNVVSRYCRFIRYNEFPPNDEPITFANSANCAYRRDALLQVGAYERLLPRLVDQDLGRRLTEAGFRLVYQSEAVVHHYHRESADVLARDRWRRGYTSILRNLLWNEELPITRERIRRERWALYRRGVRGLLFLPLTAVRLARSGVPWTDALAFAYLDWLEWTAGRRGKLEAMRRVLDGRQPVERRLIT